MEQKVLISSHDKVFKQRNFFIITSSILLISNLLLCLKTIYSDNKVIMVPGISQEMTVHGNSVSQGYLEEMSHMFLAHLLDLTPKDVAYKKERVLKYTTANGFRDIAKYFDEQINRLNKFKISTHFTPTQLSIDMQSLQVTAKGILTSHFGKEGEEEKEISCTLSFEYKGGILRLKEFGQTKVLDAGTSDEVAS
jgi:hypothetical protein